MQAGAGWSLPYETIRDAFGVKVSSMNMQKVFTRLGGITGIGGEKLAPMTNEEISDLEEELGNHFPDPYRRFLLAYGASTLNGESPDNPYILFRSLKPLPAQFKGSKGMLDAFYGGGTDESDPYSLKVRIHYFAGRMPPTIIPIGDDGGAGQICLGIKGSETGKVYYWDQANEPLDGKSYLERYGEPRPPEALFQNVHQIAESFEDFLQRLEIMKV